MRTISGELGPVRSAAALLLLALLAPPAEASGIVDQGKQYKKYPSRWACEKALRQRHAAAAARFAATPAEQRRSNRVEAPYREDGQLIYFEVLDLTVEAPGMTMPSSQTDEYSCRGRMMKHQSYLEGGSFLFIPPPPPPPEPEPEHP